MSERIDRKFEIRAICTEHHHVHTEMDSVLFLAKDRLLPATLAFYLAECIRAGVDPRQQLGVQLLLARVEAYQAAHPERVKLPDVDPAATWITKPNAAPASVPYVAPSPRHDLDEP